MLSYNYNTASPPIATAQGYSKQSGRRTGKPDAAAAAGSVVLTQTDYSSAKYLMVRTIWLV